MRVQVLHLAAIVLMVHKCFLCRTVASLLFLHGSKYMGLTLRMEYSYGSRLQIFKENVEYRSCSSLGSLHRVSTSFSIQRSLIVNKPRRTKRMYSEIISQPFRPLNGVPNLKEKKSMCSNPNPNQSKKAIPNQNHASNLAVTQLQKVTFRHTSQCQLASHRSIKVRLPSKHLPKSKTSFPLLPLMFQSPHLHPL